MIMITAQLTGCPWVTSDDERREIAERFCDALHTTFGGEGPVAAALDNYEQAAARHAPNAVPPEAAGDIAAVAQWALASERATLEAFRPWAHKSDGARFLVKVVPWGSQVAAEQPKPSTDLSDTARAPGRARRAA